MRKSNTLSTLRFKSWKVARTRQKNCGRIYRTEAETHEILPVSTKSSRFKLFISPKHCCTDVGLGDEDFIRLTVTLGPSFSLYEQFLTLRYTTGRQSRYALTNKHTKFAPAASEQSLLRGHRHAAADRYGVARTKGNEVEAIIGRLIHMDAELLTSRPTANNG
ncbi:uncharacterized protein ARMOST_02547 [Armillaria ostoyae]|uniref:Uncharacterized protein n=1 Tax=Armillaria ostoyae TaxID=47428 RepID=A0A284QS12_ARMOS|nr:uncharacterized protein ARMOST_02547 [Armillaria ostoyae]